MSTNTNVDIVEEKIIQYVNDNPGCSKSDVVRALRDEHTASRLTTLAHIDKLEIKGMVVSKLERPNSQVYKIYVNKDNKLVSVLTELEEFKRAYFKLLEKSKAILNNKDYSADAKKLGIVESNPTNWSKDERRRFFDSEHRKRGQSESRFFDLRDQLVKLKKEEDDLKAKEIIDNLIHNFEEVRNYETAFLIPYPVHIFFAFTDIMLLRSIIVWFPSIEDKQLLSQLYLVVQSKITEIQTQLSEFFGNIRVLGMNFGLDWSRNVAVFFIHTSRDPNMSFFNIDRYSVLGMDSEIRSVMDSMRNLSIEIEGYKSRFERIFLLDSIRKVKMS